MIREFKVCIGRLISKIDLNPIHIDSLSAMFIRKLSTMTRRHMREYNPLVEFKKDIRNNIIDFKSDVFRFAMAGFGAMGFGIVILYKKTETDKNQLNVKIENNAKELNVKIDKIENNAKELNAKMDLILIQISKPKNSWF